jgi:osmoprotectant transport system permease protein
VTIRCVTACAAAGVLLLALALPFINYAPNRLFSGEGRWLWQVWPWLAGVRRRRLLIALLSWLRALPLLLIFLLADLLLPLSGAPAGGGTAGSGGSPLARTSPGSGLWLALALCLLLASDAIRR